MQWTDRSRLGQDDLGQLRHRRAFSKVLLVDGKHGDKVAIGRVWSSTVVVRVAYLLRLMKNQCYVHCLSPNTGKQRHFASTLGCWPKRSVSIKDSSKTYAILGVRVPLPPSPSTWP